MAIITRYTIRLEILAIIVVLMLIPIQQPKVENSLSLVPSKIVDLEKATPQQIAISDVECTFAPIGFEEHKYSITSVKVFVVKNDDKPVEFLEANIHFDSQQCPMSPIQSGSVLEGRLGEISVSTFSPLTFTPTEKYHLVVTIAPKSTRELIRFEKEIIVPYLDLKSLDPLALASNTMLDK